MSVSLGYYFNAEKDLPELVADCNQWIGCHLEPTIGAPETAYSAFFNSVSLDLSLNTFNPQYDPFGAPTQDGAIPFSRYKYELDVTVYGGQDDMQPIMLPTMLSAIYVLHRRLGIRGMLVFDAQILLAQYEEIALRPDFKTLSDKLSGTNLLPFNVHCAALMKALPESWQSY